MALVSLQVEKRIGRVRKDKSADKNELSGLEKVLPFLEDGKAARWVGGWLAGCSCSCDDTLKFC